MNIIEIFGIKLYLKFLNHEYYLNAYFKIFSGRLISILLFVNKRLTISMLPFSTAEYNDGLLNYNIISSTFIFVNYIEIFNF